MFDATQLFQCVNVSVMWPSFTRLCSGMLTVQKSCLQTWRGFGCLMRLHQHCGRARLPLTLFVSVFFPSVAVIAAVTHDTDSTVSTHWYTDRKFTIVVTAVLVILPLSIPKEISFQKYARYRRSASGPFEGPNSFCSVSHVLLLWLQRFECDGDLVRYRRGHCKVYLAGWRDDSRLCFYQVSCVCVYLLTAAPLSLPNGCFRCSSSSWTAVFNAMPTICFGFQVSLHL